MEFLNTTSMQLKYGFMYRSNRSLNIPPGIPRAFDVFSCPVGREFDHYSLGVGNLIAHIDRADSTRGDKSWRRKPSCIQSERYPIRGGLAEKQRLAQALFSIWRYSRTIYIIFGMIKTTEKFPGVGAFDHLGSEQLFGLGRGGFEQKFFKNSNARGGCWSW